MKVLFFAAGGELALRPLDAVAEVHEVVAVVRPASRSRFTEAARRAARALGFRPADRVADWARRAGVPTYTADTRSSSALVELLRPLTPEVSCIATFPTVLPADVLSLAAHGTVNVHPSLLPRHRGPNPLFWTYFRADENAGVTIHRAVERADAGPILRQEAMPLARGFPVVELHRALAAKGARLLVQALEDLEQMRAADVPQDEAQATPAPRVRSGTRMVDFDAWPVDRVWHFLAGMCPQFIEPLQYGGRRVRYRAVLHFERAETQQRPGTLTPAAHGWDLHCVGGTVALARRAAGGR